MLQGELCFKAPGLIISEKKLAFDFELKRRISLCALQWLKRIKILWWIGKYTLIFVGKIGGSICVDTK